MHVQCMPDCVRVPVRMHMCVGQGRALKGDVQNWMS